MVWLTSGAEARNWLIQSAQVKWRKKVSKNDWFLRNEWGEGGRNIIKKHGIHA